MAPRAKKDKDDVVTKDTDIKSEKASVSTSKSADKSAPEVKLESKEIKSRGFTTIVDSILPQSNGSAQVIVTDPNQEAQPIDPSESITKNKVWTNKKSRNILPHRGLVELPEIWKTDASFEDVNGVKQTVMEEPRPTNKYAKTEDGITLNAVGTFTQIPTKNVITGMIEKSVKYNNDDAIDNVDNGLIDPTGAVPAYKRSSHVNGMPGKVHGAPLTAENALSMEGLEVVTSDTLIACIESVNKLIEDNDTANLTCEMFERCGVSAVRQSKQNQYRAALALHGKIADSSELQVIIAEVNQA